MARVENSNTNLKKQSRPLSRQKIIVIDLATQGGKLAIE
jgi:hypothetical protein